MNRIWIVFACWSCACLSAGPLSAGVVVVQNWTPAKISFAARIGDGQVLRYTLIPTDIAAISSDGPVSIAVGEGDRAVTRVAAVNSIHYLGLRDGKPDLVRLRLPGIDDKPEPPSPPTVPQAVPANPTTAPAKPAAAAQTPPGVYKIPVAILVDTADKRTRAVWEKQLRKRVEDCSDVFEHHCHVRFEVVAVGTWESNPNVHTFNEALMDFAQKVRPAPARVAIGFTSRYDWLQEEAHLGATHGTLASHVLIREKLGRISEPERLEVLVHELGHFLGAAHTSDENSVMRPKLGDGRSNAKSFRIGFDAPNTLIMNLVAEEMRTRHLWHPTLLSAEAKVAIRGAYMVLAKTIPTDPVAASAIQALGPLPQAAAPGAASPELINGARLVVQTITRSAHENDQLPVTSKDPKMQRFRTGDELTSFYIRRAAAAARQLRGETAPAAFLLGMGIALDESNYVRDKPALKDVWQKIDPEDQRRARMLLIGSPTIHNRHDLLGHFTMSAALTVLSGPEGAEAAGLGKEILDSRSGSGFSFVDICVDMSGVMFATHVREDNIPLEDVAKNFAIGNFVPSLEGLPEELTWDAFQKQYGEGASESFHRQRSEIFHRILALPPYRPAESKKKPEVGEAKALRYSTEK